jgi:hypothetical protein
MMVCLTMLDSYHGLPGDGRTYDCSPNAVAPMLSTHSRKPVPVCWQLQAQRCTFIGVWADGDFVNGKWVSATVPLLGTSWDRGVRRLALPRAPGSWVRLIALCVASLWESAPPGNPQTITVPLCDLMVPLTCTCYSL